MEALSNEYEYVWNINDQKLMQKILHAKYKDKFSSTIFEMANMFWSIVICPNGASSKGCFEISLQLVQSHSSFKEVIIQKSAVLLQTKSSHTSLVTYDENKKNWGMGTQCNDTE